MVDCSSKFGLSAGCLLLWMLNESKKFWLIFDVTCENYVAKTKSKVQTCQNTQKSDSPAHYKTPTTGQT